MFKTFKVITPLFVIASLLLLSGCGGSKDFAYKVDFEVWGIFDDSDAYTEVINQYKQINPHVGKITYRKFTAEAYKQDLVNALASGKGPDIFMFHNTWLPTFEDRVEPMPETIITPKEFTQNFVDVVATDFVKEGKVYSLPLSVDSLALYYNKDLLNADGIVSPPATWEEFFQAAKKMTKRDAAGNFVQSGAAIGTAYNVNRATDILSLMMLQGGAQMVDQKTSKATFDAEQGQAGQQALQLYTEFARAASPAYSWNKALPDSIAAFAEGRVAMMVNYSWQYEAIASRNSKLNFGVSSVPQMQPLKKVNVANYWGYAVTKHKETTPDPQKPEAVPIPDKVRTLEAWQFLKFLTMKNNGTVKLTSAASGESKDFPVNFDPAVSYLKKTGKPAARRDIIDLQKTDLRLTPFVEGNLIAKNWYQKDPEAVDRIFVEMIDSVNRGSSNFADALTLGAQRMNQLLAQ